MRIGLFSTSSDPVAGWGNITLELSDFFFRHNIHFYLYVPSQETIPDATPWAKCFRPILPKKCNDYFERDFLNILSFDLNKFEDIDLIYSLDCTSISYLCYRLAKNRNIPFVQGIQGTYGVLYFNNPIKQFFHKKIITSCHGLIGPSRFSITLIQNFLENYDLLSKAKVIHNGVNFKRFYRPLNENDIITRFKRRPIEFVAIGGLKIRKGLDTTILAIAEVIKKYPEVRLKIIGPGSPESLHKLTQENGIESNVSFCGALFGEDLVNELHNSFAYLHSPRMYQWNFEGFGIVYLEANACGLPAIGTYSGGVSDAVIHRETGLLAQEDDPLNLAQQILTLIEDQSLYLKLSLAGMMWAQNHDWDIIGTHYLNFFNLVNKSWKEGHLPFKKRHFI